MHGYKNVNTEIDPFIPKNEMRQQIEFVLDFPFVTFCRFNKQNKLVNNK